MQGVMAQMTQMGQLMENMQRAATAGQQQQQQEQPPPNGGVISRIINDISRQRPPIFEGSSEPADIIHWIDHFENLFEMVNCPAENRTTVVAYYLSKGAHTWWLATRPTDGVYTWEEFKNRMYDRYYPAPLREAKLSELLNPITTEDEDVLSIAEKFQALLPFATSIIRSEANKIKYFLKRLKPRMRMQLLNHHCTTLAEFIEKALENELTTKELFKKPSPGVKRSKGQPDDSKGAFKKPPPVHNSSTKAPASFKSSGLSSRAVSSNSTCHNCGAKGHISPNCPKPLIQCDACGKSGHRAKYCRGGSGRTLTAPYVSAQPLTQIRAPPSSSYQTTGANQGMGRGNQASTSGVGTSKPRVYEMRKADDLEANMIAGTLEINSQPVCVLFDTGASHSFLSTSCLDRLHLDIVNNCEPYMIGLPNGRKIVGNHEVQDCPILMNNRIWFSNLIVVDLPKDDVILGIDCNIRNFYYSCLILFILDYTVQFGFCTVEIK
ncbi:hypothetical protein OROGR_029126 [Orobanche gracilis]